MKEISKTLKDLNRNQLKKSYFFQENIVRIGGFILIINTSILGNMSIEGSLMENIMSKVFHFLLLLLLIQSQLKSLFSKLADIISKTKHKIPSQG